MFCFLEGMEGVQKNIANPHMKAPELNVGVITPPDKFHKPVLYSEAEATQKFNQLSKDVYQMQKKYSFEDSKKTPKSVFYVLGAAVLTGLGFLIKALFKNNPLEMRTVTIDTVFFVMRRVIMKIIYYL